jgi:hypothetical protein
MSNRQVFALMALILLIAAGVTIITASPDSHPIRFGP